MSQLVRSPLALMKAGGEIPPIFVAHGLGGTIEELRELVDCIPLGHPIYAIQTLSVAHLSLPPSSIEAMAKAYIEAIVRVQPNGPYLIVGYSFGGLIALEIAQQLSASGNSIGMLMLIDSYPHPSRLAAGQRWRLTLRRARRRVARALRLRAPANKHPKANHPFALAPDNVRENTSLAWRTYSPRFYRGKMEFLRAAMPSNFPDDVAPVWAHLAEEFEVETVPGDHRSMLTKYAANTAAVLSRRLRDSLIQFESRGLTL